MKSNAIIRIVIYSLVTLLLLGILLAGLGFGSLSFSLGSGNYITGEGAVDASQVKNLHIEWAAGSIEIVTADTDKITFTETGYASEEQRMAYELNGGTLTICYKKPSIQIGFFSVPNKILTVTVPRDWVCNGLELDGVSINVNVQGLTADSFKLDGASCDVKYDGAVNYVDCDGASCSLELRCMNRPQEVRLDGASCELDLLLPAQCGFRAALDGLSCTFRSDLNCTNSDGQYSYGDGYCRIEADGVSCDITVNQYS